MGSDAPPTLPPPDRAAEDSFLRACEQRDDLDAIAALVGAALDARRPQLAARLVGLLDQEVEVTPGSALDRARRAARLLMLAPSEPELSWVEELDEAWQLARQARLVRTQARMRQRGEEGGLNVLGASPGARRRPRLTGRNRRG